MGIFGYRGMGMSQTIYREAECESNNSQVQVVSYKGTRGEIAVHIGAMQMAL